MREGLTSRRRLARSSDDGHLPVQQINTAHKPPHLPSSAPNVEMVLTAAMLRPTDGLPVPPILHP